MFENFLAFHITKLPVSNCPRQRTHFEMHIAKISAVSHKKPLLQNCITRMMLIIMFLNFFKALWFSIVIIRIFVALQKGGGYHLDLLIVGVLIIVCSIFGLPWFVAATVLSINHVRSLTRESECSAPGEKPQFLGIRYERVFSDFFSLRIFLFIKSIDAYTAHRSNDFGAFLYILPRNSVLFRYSETGYYSYIGFYP